jgi:hypothetical protein
MPGLGIRTAVNMNNKTTNSKPERCGSCNGVINLQTGECRCSD